MAWIDTCIWFSLFIWVWLGFPGHAHINNWYYTCNMSKLNWAMMLTLCILVYIHRNSKLIWLFQSDSLVLALKFSQPIRLLNSFTQSISRVAKPSDFIFYMAVQHHDWNQLNKFWSLTGFDILSGCPLKSSAFESIFKLMKNCHFLTFLLLFFLKDAFKFDVSRALHFYHCPCLFSRLNQLSFYRTLIKLCLFFIKKKVEYP